MRLVLKYEQSICSLVRRTLNNQDAVTPNPEIDLAMSAFVWPDNNQQGSCKVFYVSHKKSIDARVCIFLFNDRSLADPGGAHS